MVLIDDVRIKVAGGDGGNGSMATLRMPTGTKSYPDGGDGGNGGDVYTVPSSNISDLNQFRYVKSVVADDGGKGLGKNQHGKNGEDKTILLPPGTKIIDEATGEEIEMTDQVDPVLIASGGRGGRGSHGFRPGPAHYTYTNEGGRGERKNLHLILSLIADAGFIGFPNAGKSSLLARLTNATPKIGNYPFTTLEPSLGTMPARRTGGGKVVLADIPGIIEGASSGRGLGITFLKHIEKTKVLLNCITCEDPNPLKTYQLVHKEFEEFNVKLNEKREVILLTKKDLTTEDELKEKVKILSEFNRTIIPVSIYDDESIKKLTEVILRNTI
ncbi:MAG: Obg family GTPase CgtA [Candidatus Levybacteria bacterium RIFCSPHIGHO2_02_FULL_39_36]|nr:MAG: GTPase obg [Candidatus Levybacteria bacterium GW2011_GWA1_39_11]KKR24857.1 MAG: GTPase obg [Candidatus Levybacteria bacterium GW2011_GWB1_39_7]KKR50098.1 MAG: GTPase obg [Candidatus Levybacteria bacterium GW2011_GWA2_40_16]OGH15434.1 MAG: Obg family GTPase CgtA [Candidatus Levybacteria bacterium RIFCSPHIGHO2_01_FULL_38_96]OGH26029.1 MAG: Obg family GTPase CgtA [Candidatus Levybacteria bacterium RIFCSPHIGHO2_12_FULL_39_39]OGH28871.1 MAG: Obg family GTPase CgtA [Candidatus Levybacteria b